MNKNSNRKTETLLKDMEEELDNVIYTTFTNMITYYFRVLFSPTFTFNFKAMAVKITVGFLKELD